MLSAVATTPTEQLLFVADGVVVGNYRCSLAGLDLNRQWSNPSKDVTPVIYALYCLLWQHRRVLSIYLDLHGHSCEPDAFFYGCDDRDPETGDRTFREQLLPVLAARETPLIDYKKCKFSVKKSKLSTARVAVCKEFKIPDCLTLEASCAGRWVEGKLVHHGTSDLEQIGEALGKSFEALCVLRSSSSAMAEMLQEIRKDLSETGNLNTDDESDCDSDHEPWQGNLEQAELQDRWAQIRTVRESHSVVHAQAEAPAKDTKKHRRNAPMHRRLINNLKTGARMDVTELMKGPQPKGPRGGGNGAVQKGEMNITGDNILRHSKVATPRVPDTPTQNDFGLGGWCSSVMPTCTLGGVDAMGSEPGLHAFVKMEDEARPIRSPRLFSQGGRRTMRPSAEQPAGHHPAPSTHERVNASLWNRTQHQEAASAFGAVSGKAQRNPHRTAPSVQLDGALRMSTPRNVTSTHMSGAMTDRSPKAPNPGGITASKPSFSRMMTGNQTSRRGSTPAAEQQCGPRGALGTPLQRNRFTFANPAVNDAIHASAQQSNSLQGNTHPRTFQTSFGSYAQQSMAPDSSMQNSPLTFAGAPMHHQQPGTGTPGTRNGTARVRNGTARFNATRRPLPTRQIATTFQTM